MKRRKFLTSLVAIPAGLVAAAKAKPSALNLDEIFDQLYAIRKTRQSMVPDWFQTTRTTRVWRCHNDAYTKVLDDILGGETPEYLKNVSR